MITMYSHFEYESIPLASIELDVRNPRKNIGAERPYVVKDGNHFVVVEGNTRVAADKKPAHIQ